MEIFNIGAPELILILLIMLIVLGPEQSVTHMKSLARFIRKLVRSPLWAEILNTSREIKELPNKMMRESGLEDDITDLNRQINPSVARPAVQRSSAGGQPGKTVEPTLAESPQPANPEIKPPDRPEG